MTNMGIIVPGYEPFLPNEVYVRHDGFTPNAEDIDEPVPLSHVLILSRFDEPNITDIASYLTDRAGTLEGVSMADLLLANLPPSPSTDVDLALCSLPESIRGIITEGGEGLIELLTDYDLSQEDHGRYVCAMYGVLPTIDAKTQYAVDITRNPEWFVSTMTGDDYMARGYGQRLTLKLGLNNGILPSIRTLNWLLGINALDSDFMSVQVYTGDIMEIKGLLGLIYTALDTPARILELPDYSQSSLEFNAAGILRDVMNEMKDDDTHMGGSKLN